MEGYTAREEAPSWTIDSIEESQPEVATAPDLPSAVLTAAVPAKEWC